MTEEQKIGTVEKYETVYAPLRQFGIPARVWDEVLDEMFDLPVGQVPGPLQMVHSSAKTEIATLLDMFPRKEGVSDHDYVRGIMEDANAYWQTLAPIDRDFWEFDLERGVSKKRLPNDEPPRRFH